MTKYLTIEQFEGFDDNIIKCDDDSIEEKNQKAVPVGSREHILNLQLCMATSSVNHEYARMEYEETGKIDRKEELMYYMSECRQKYDEARDELSCVNPLILETFEQDLAAQKSSTMVHYHA